MDSFLKGWKEMGKLAGIDEPALIVLSLFYIKPRYKEKTDENI